jgi:hypothetical protein
MGIPSNLIPINASQISGSVQSLAGQIPQIPDAPEIPQFSLLNSTLPDSLFTTGSPDQIRDTTLEIAEQAINLLRVTRPTFPILPPVNLFSPKLPSFGQIKNFINTKIDRIKRQRQQASIKALRDDLEQRENPFTYRQTLTNQQNTKSLERRLRNQ